MRDPKARVKLMLAVHTLNQAAVYTKSMIAFESDFPQDVELALCLYEKPEGGFEFTIEDGPPPADLPGPPEPDSGQRTVRTFEIRDTITLKADRVVLRSPPPTLPENPTAKQRWEFLLAVVRQK